MVVVRAEAEMAVEATGGGARAEATEAAAKVAAVTVAEVRAEAERVAATARAAPTLIQKGNLIQRLCVSVKAL